MCRFQCTCPPPRFTVTPVERDARESFVRNRSVNFFSPDSDDSDEEVPLHGKMRGGKGTEQPAESSSSTLSSLDSGFGETTSGSTTVDEEEERRKLPLEETRQLRSILRLRQQRCDEEPAKAKKAVRFADRCGQQLVAYRTIAGRHENSLLSELVELDSAIFCQSERTLSFLKHCQQILSECHGIDEQSAATTV